MNDKILFILAEWRELCNSRASLLDMWKREKAFVKTTRALGEIVQYALLAEQNGEDNVSIADIELAFRRAYERDPC